MNYTTQTLRLEQVSLHDKLQPRAVIDEDVIQSYSEDMSSGDVFKEIDVFFDGDNYWLADGYHRYHAYSRIGQSDVSCNVYIGDFNEARKYALRANKSHGTRRNKTDIKRALELALDLWIETERNESKLLPTQKELASLVGCSQQVTSKHWEYLLSSVQNTTHGILNTTNKKENAFELIKDNPNMTIRELSKLSGLSVGTVKNLKDEYLAKIELEKENSELKERVIQLENKKDIESQQQTIFDLQKQIEDNKLAVKKAEKSKSLAKRKQEYLLSNLDKMAEDKARKLVEKELETKREQWKKFESNLEVLIQNRVNKEINEVAEQKEKEFKEKLKEKENEIIKLEKKANSTDDEKITTLQKEKDNLQGELDKITKNKTKTQTKMSEVFEGVKTKKKEVEEKSKQLTELLNRLNTNDRLNSSLSEFCDILNKSTGNVLSIQQSLCHLNPENLVNTEVTIGRFEHFYATKRALLKVIEDIEQFIDSYKLALSNAPTSDEVNQEILVISQEVDQIYQEIEITAQAV